MSHFVSIRTELREKQHLLNALSDLGLAYQEGDRISLTSDMNQQETAEIVASTDCVYEIGFRRLSDRFEMIADWFNIERLTSLKRRTFLEQLTQRYSYSLVRDQAHEQNLIVEEERQENGDIILVLSERG